MIVEFRTHRTYLEQVARVSDVYMLVILKNICIKNTILVFCAKQLVRNIKILDTYCSVNNILRHITIINVHINLTL